MKNEGVGIVPDCRSVSIYIILSTTIKEIDTFMWYLFSNDNVASPNNIRCIVSFNVVIVDGVGACHRFVLIREIQ